MLASDPIMTGPFRDTLKGGALIGWGGPVIWGQGKITWAHCQLTMDDGRISDTDDGWVPQRYFTSIRDLRM